MHHAHGKNKRHVSLDVLHLDFLLKEIHFTGIKQKNISL